MAGFAHSFSLVATEARPFVVVCPNSSNKAVHYSLNLGDLTLVWPVFLGWNESQISGKQELVIKFAR